MLVAQNSNNKLILLHSQIPRKTLLELKKSNEFFCPQCKEAVILKIGNFKVPHFSHFSKTRCEQAFSDNESLTHILGKEHLYKLFKQLNEITPQLEPFIKEIQQRPDLLIKKNKKSYAIEFQCSPIDEKIFLSRNEGYKAIGIKPIWIPLTPSNINNAKQVMKLSLPLRFHKFLVKHKNNPFYITYNPHNKQFVYFSNLLHVYGNSYLSKIVTLPLLKQRFPFYYPKLITSDEFTTYLKAYNKIKKKYLQSRIMLSKKGVNDLFLRSLYEMRLSIESLPNFLGIPIRGNEYLKLFSIEWQTALFYFMHLNKMSFSKMNRQAIKYFLEWAKLPLIDSCMIVVENYCILINNLGIKHISSKVSDQQLNHEVYRQFVAFNWET